MSEELQKTDEPKPLALINLALEKGIDVDKLTRLFDLQERWEKKEAEKEFNAAFANFQRECPEIKKTKKAEFTTKSGGRMSYAYAPLPEIIKQIKEPLAKNGLSYRWEFQEQNTLIECTCFVSHFSGHTKTSKLSAPKDETGNKNIIQQIGSTHTYLQRYSLIGALGISSADSDNDGRSYSPPPKPKELSEEEKKKQKVTLEKYKKEFEDFKTPTEIKINSKEMFAKAEQEGVAMDELKEFVRKLYDGRVADAKKVEMKNKEQKPVNLP